MRDDFCAFILSHGRPDRVYTLETLTKAGYTGKVYIVIDDEDKTGAEYLKRYGDRVLTFSKDEAARDYDEGDNFNDRRAIFYARNMCFRLAEQVGCRYFIELDDDYTGFEYRFRSNGEYGYSRVTHTMDALIDTMLDFYESIPAASIAFSQGGDFLGGVSNHNCLRRKAMNSFFCSVDRPFAFIGRVNEDVNTYTTESRRGRLFFTVMAAKLVQLQTQTNSGGMTGLYLDSGTYLKTFYSVMYCPSAVKIGTMGDPRSDQYRIHHAINWHNAAPKILREDWKK